MTVETVVAIVGHVLAWGALIGGWLYHCLQDRERFGRIEGQLEVLLRDRKSGT